jgi:hypothetical protein
MSRQSVSLSKQYLFYLVLVQLRYTSQRKTIAIMYSPESGRYVEQGYSLKSLLRQVLIPKGMKLTNAANIVESSKPQFSLLLNFTQTRTKKAKADQVKNNAVAVLSQGARLPDILGRAAKLLIDSSKQSE